ncbi:MAG: preprotein translocase subunit SecG [Patescibacteria group bacterium]
MAIAIAQIIISIILIALILLQEHSSGLSGIFGGNEASFYSVRRGLERIIFGATIVFIVILAGLSILDLFI